MLSEDKYTEYYTKGLVESYFSMFTTGCGKRKCKHPACAANPNVSAMSPNDAAIRSITWSIESGNRKLCKPLKKNFAQYLDAVPMEDSDSVPETDDADWIPQSSPRKKLVDAIWLDQTLSSVHPNDIHAMKNLSQRPLRNNTRQN